MDSAPEIVEISSDEEELPEYDWISDWLDEKKLEGFGDIEVDCRSPSQKTADDLNDSDDDCLILDGDPDKSVSVDHGEGREGDESEDLLIVGEKGQLACRDYPHPRHLCAKLPFSTTPHEKYCNLCHCYVCDSPAPCFYWENCDPLFGHCHSTDKEEYWRTLRKTFKLRNETCAQSQRARSSNLYVAPPIQNTSFIHDLNPISLPRLSTRSTARQHGPSNRVARRPISQNHQSSSTHITNHCQSISEHPTRPRSSLSGRQSAQREKRQADDLAAQISRSHVKMRRVGTTGNNYAFSNTNQFPLGGSNHNQSFRSASQRSQCPPATLDKENAKKWREIIQAVGAELGVENSGGICSSQSRTVSYRPMADQHCLTINACQNADIFANPAVQTAYVNSSNSFDFDASWLINKTSAKNTAEHGWLHHPQQVSVQPLYQSVPGKINWDYFLDSAPGATDDPEVSDFDPASPL